MPCGGSNAGAAGGSGGVGGGVGARGYMPFFKAISQLERKKKIQPCYTVISSAPQPTREGGGVNEMADTELTGSDKITLPQSNTFSAQTI